MIATTVGQGPFQPAISWQGRLWVMPTEYASEDNAVIPAQQVLEQMLARATEALTAGGFVPTRQ